MILILGNVPYHHKLGIPSFSSLSKGKLYDEVEKYITTDKPINLPITELTPDRLTYGDTNGIIVEKEEVH